MKAICKGFSIFSIYTTGKPEIDPFTSQTLNRSDTSENADLWFVSLYNDEAHFPDNLFEKMAWAILTRPGTGVIFQPLHLRIETKTPEISSEIPVGFSDIVAETGFIAVFSSQSLFDGFVQGLKNKSDYNCASFPVKALKKEIDKLIRTKKAAATFTRPLFTAKNSLAMPLRKIPDFSSIKTSIKDRARTTFAPEIRMHAKKLIHMIRPENPYNVYPPAEPDIAMKKTWESGMDDIRIKISIKDTGDKIPVLMIMHWLEVSGAERFAIELVRHLPKDKYAVYLLTDVSSDNPWEHLVRDHVEEIFHLPDFLERNLFKSFYVHFLETRKIRLAHINHAPEFYRSLAHVRRFNTKVKILDSLYIIELPPIPGGYPDYSARFAEPFIDMHHVACVQIKDFLSQRWHVPDEKMTLIYLNVDPDEFDPDKVNYGDTRKKYGIPDSACAIGFIGRFVEQKRPLVFVETVAKTIEMLPPEKRGEDSVCFVMAGSGYLDEKVRKRIDELGLEKRIILTGNISELKSFYRDMDIIAMPSANEGVALVTFEAMAMETPLLFADVGAQSELLPEELLVPDSQNEKELAGRFAEKCLPFILDNEMRKETGKNLRKYILENHTDKMTYSAFESLYNHMCQD